MASQWPPSPHVEDEELALKSEISQKADITSKPNADEARCRGSIDQCPIILDVGHDAETSERDCPSSTDNEGDSVRTQSSDDSYGPPTPPPSKIGRKHDQLPPGRPVPQSRSAKGQDELKNEAASRGRPSMPRIHTDIGSDIQEMITGQRRAPSPYLYTKPDAASQPDFDKNRSSGSTFLSPESLLPAQTHFAQTHPPAHRSKRHSSARPRSKSTSRKDSDDSSEVETRRRHHSRRRSARPSSPRARSSIDDGSGDLPPSQRRSSYYAYSRPEKIKLSMKGGGAEAPLRNDTKYGQEPYLSKAFPCAGQAEVARSQNSSDGVPKGGKRLSKETTYPSSTEEDRSYRRDIVTGDKDTRSHQPTVRKERPRLDLSGPQYAFPRARTDSSAPSDTISKPGRTAGDNAVYRSKDYPHQDSPHPSPRVSSRPSPSCTPVCTPRGDRRSADYFSQGSSASVSSLDAVRQGPPSHSEGQYASTKPTAGVAAATFGAHAVPSASRGPVFSADIYPSGNSQWPASLRRSRNASPASAGREPVFRTGREHDKGQLKVDRVEEMSNSRPGLLRAESVAYNPPPTTSSDGFNAKSTSYATTSSARPRMNPRAFSQSAADEPHSRQPGTAKSAPLHFGLPLTPNRAPLPNTPRVPRSPSLSERLPRQVPFAELPTCPRSVAVSGYCDWYTVAGMPQLDVCPSCMTVLGASPFRDMFMPSKSTVVGQRILCDFSRPWVRRAWAQIIKQRRSTLEMIYQVVRNAETTRPCPGKGSDIRAWYRLPDPAKGSNVPNFDACSECVRSVEIIFPQLRGIFKRPGALVQERTCDLNTQSRRFDGYIKLLDAAALQYDVERLREPNIQPFANHARKLARVRECTRDDMVLDQVWHFIPWLPQFTICEECFEQVVWPVADQPVARSVNRTLQLVPGTLRSTGLSCQLYSERMRKAFLEAVQHGDPEYLKQVALKRYDVERQLQEKHKDLLTDVSMGLSRNAELQANVNEWREWE